MVHVFQLQLDIFMLCVLAPIFGHVLYSDKLRFYIHPIVHWYLHYWMFALGRCFFVYFFVVFSSFVLSFCFLNFVQYFYPFFYLFRKILFGFSDYLRERYRKWLSFSFFGTSSCPRWSFIYPWYRRSSNKKSREWIKGKQNISMVKFLFLCAKEFMISSSWLCCF